MKISPKILGFLAVIFFLLGGEAYATKITVPQQTVNNWTRTTTAPKIRAFLDRSFTASTGEFLERGSPDAGVAYKEITTTISGNVVTIPTFQLDSTTDGKDVRTARYSFYWYDDQGNNLGPVDGMTNVRVPEAIISTSGCSPAGTCAAFHDLRVYNAGSPRLDVSTFYNKKEVDDKIASVLGTTLSYSSPLSKSGNTISIQQANASQPGFLSSSDWSVFNSKQAADSDLDGIGALSTTGISVRTGTGTWTTRSVSGTTNQVSVTNGTGVAGDIILSLPQNIHTGAEPTFNKGTFSSTIGVGTFADVNELINMHLTATPSAMLNAIDARLEYPVAPSTFLHSDFRVTLGGGTPPAFAQMMNLSIDYAMPGTLPDGTIISGGVVNNSASQITTVHGLNLLANNANSGSMPTVKLARLSAVNSATGSMGTVRGLSFENWSNGGGSWTKTSAIHADTSIDVGTTRYFIESTSTSQSLLSGPLVNTGHTAIGNDGTVNPNVFGGSANTVLAVAETYAAIPSNDLYGQVVRQTFGSIGGSVTSSVTGSFAQVDIPSGNSTSFSGAALFGIRARLVNSGSGAKGSIFGSRADVITDARGGFSSVYGGYFSSFVDGTSGAGSGTDIVGVFANGWVDENTTVGGSVIGGWFRASNHSTAGPTPPSLIAVLADADVPRSTTNAYGVKVTASNGTSATNGYGVYVETVASSTNPWAFYSASSAPSFLTGALQFGEIAAPATPAANRVTIYAKDNGSGQSRLYYKGDDGSEIGPLGTGGGGGGSVDSVFGRTGAVVAVNTDYGATGILLNNNVSLSGKDGVGTPFSLVKANTSNQVEVGASGTNTTINGHVYPAATNTFDLGNAPGSFDWRTGYFGTSVHSPKQTFTSGATLEPFVVQAAGDFTATGGTQYGVHFKSLTSDTASGSVKFVPVAISATLEGTLATQTFTALEVNATNTITPGSAEGFKLIDLQLAGVSKFNVNRLGQAMFGSAVAATSAVNPGLFLNETNSKVYIHTTGSNSPEILGFNWNTSLSAPEATPSGRRILRLSGGGYGNAAALRAADISMFSSSLWSATNLETHITFSTTPNASTTLTEGMRLTSAQRLLVGTTTDNGVNRLQVSGSTLTAGLTSSDDIVAQAKINASDAIQLLLGSELRFYDADSSNLLAFKAPTSVTTDLTYIWPSDTPTNGEQLTASITGSTVTLSWDAAGSGGGGDWDSITAPNANQSLDMSTFTSTWTANTAITNTVNTLLTIGHNTSGTAAASFGTRTLFKLESSTTTDQDAAAIDVVWTTATHASRTSALVFSTVNNAGALSEGMRLRGDGFLEFTHTKGIAVPSGSQLVLSAPSTGSISIEGASILLGAWARSNRNTIQSSGITVTESGFPLMDLAVTWNASGVTHDGIKLNVTNTASAAGSKLIDLQVGGTSKFKVDKDGLTTARIAPRVTSITSNATWSPSADNDDIYIITAQGAAVTTISNPSGTPTQGQKLMIRVKDDGTARALTWSGTQWRASTDLALPTTTTAGKTMYLGFIWNATDSKWDLVSKLDNF
jgi:hypothetical protein